MYEDRRIVPTNQGKRSSTALRVVSIVTGVILILLGILMLVAAAVVGFEGEEIGLLIFFAIMGLAPIMGGATLFILSSRLRRYELQAMNQPSALPASTYAPPTYTSPTYTSPTYTPSPIASVPSQPTDTAGERQVISREVIAGTPGGVVDAPQPTPEPEAAQNAAPKRVSGGDTTEELANLVSRSSNLFATLKDLVRHESTSKPTSRRHLASMLEETGLMQWDDAPICETARLTRNHHFWIRYNTDSLTDEEYDRLISIEAALSVNQDLGNLAATATVQEASGEVPSHLMKALSTQTIKRYDLSDSLTAAYPGVGEADIPGEWLVRTSFSSDAECAATPFRVVYDFRANVEEHLMVISIEVPRPRCMSIFTTDTLARVALARSYALRLSVLLAQNAFEHTVVEGRPLIETVIVNCHKRGSSETILSTRLTKDLLSRLCLLLADGSALEGSAFPTSKDIRAEFGPDGWFLPVEPFMTFSDEAVSPAWRFVYPELVDRPVSDRLRTVSGAKIVEDLGINENASRLYAWDELSKETWQSTTEAVSALVQCRDSTQDISVIEACARTMDALLAGSIDASDTQHLGDLFIKGTALEDAVRVAEAALDESTGPDHPEEAIAALSKALAPIESVGAYLDDTDTVYRYFGSIAERIRFNLDIDDHSRAVHLVPDAYYNAVANISIAYDELNETEKAMQYAQELVRIAPASIHATMRVVRVLEHQSRIFEAADLIKGILRFASTPRDAAICHYRLAYMEWKLGREDLAVACYQRSMAWDTDVINQSREELDDLIAGSEGLHRFSDDEVASLLAKEGIPLGYDDSDKRRILASAVLCTDEGVFWAARPLVGILFATNNDDVMMGIYHSLIR